MASKMATKLTETQLRVLQLRYEGLRNKEIAERLGVSEPAISQILSRITKKLASIQDILASMKDLGVIEHDIEIELTSHGKAFSKEWKKARLPRIQKTIKNPAPTITMMVSKGKVSYTGFEQDIFKNVGRARVQEMDKRLISVPVQIDQGARFESFYKKEKQFRDKMTPEGQYRYIHN